MVWKTMIAAIKTVAEDLIWSCLLLRTCAQRADDSEVHNIVPI